jgi:hypothetical protein
MTRVSRLRLGGGGPGGGYQEGNFILHRCFDLLRKRGLDLRKVWRFPFFFFKIDDIYLIYLLPMFHFISSTSYAFKGLRIMLPVFSCFGFLARDQWLSHVSTR